MRSQRPASPSSLRPFLCARSRLTVGGLAARKGCATLSRRTPGAEPAPRLALVAAPLPLRSLATDRGRVGGAAGCAAGCATSSRRTPGAEPAPRLARVASFLPLRSLATDRWRVGGAAGCATCRWPPSSRRTPGAEPAPRLALVAAPLPLRSSLSPPILCARSRLTVGGLAARQAASGGGRGCTAATGESPTARGGASCRQCLHFAWLLSVDVEHLLFVVHVHHVDHPFGRRVGG